MNQVLNRRSVAPYNAQNKKMEKIIVGTEKNGVVAGKPPLLMVDGVETPLKEVSHKEILCEQDTSYRGDVLDSWRVYESPYGLIERHYWARGAGLERSGIDFRVIPVSEIEALQKRAQETAQAAQEAAEALVALCKKSVEVTA